MSATTDFYLARADECAREAEEAVLANVRDRCLRSEVAWRAMAERLVSSEAARDRNAAEKAALAAE